MLLFDVIRPAILPKINHMKASRIISIASVFIAPFASAAVLAGWDFDPLTGGANNFGTSPLTATTAASGVTIGGLTRGSGIGTTGTGAGNAWGGMDFTTTSPSFATALAASEYVTFTLTADAGKTVSLSDIGAYNIRRSSSGPTTGQWQYQVGAGAFSDIGTAITWGTTTTSAGNSKASIDLSAITALQDVTAGTVITIRLVTWGASGSAGTFYLNDPSNTPGDDFTLNGTVTTPVPEPATALLGTIGIIGLLRRRR